MKTIIFIPGLGHGMRDDQTLESYSYRYLKALNLIEKGDSKNYESTKSKVGYGKDNEYSAEMTEILEIVGDEKGNAVLRVLQFDYADLITRSTKNKNIFLKFLVISHFFFANALSFIKSIFWGRKGVSNLGQHMYIGTVLGLVGLGGILLIPAILHLVPDLGIQIGESSIDFIDQRLNSMYNTRYWGFFIGLSSFALIAATLLALLFPDFRGTIDELSNRFLGLNNYVRIGDERLNIIGKLETLLEKASKDSKTREIEIHGLSTGSLILLDSLFPKGNCPTPSFINKVDSIVTIGCIFSIVTNLFPKYFDSRRVEEVKLKQWYNIYSNVDIISTNFDKKAFRDNPLISNLEKRLKPINIEFSVAHADNLGLWDYFMMIGLRAHDMYWGSKLDSVNCLRDLLIVQRKVELNDEVAPASASL